MASTGLSHLRLPPPGRSQLQLDPLQRIAMTSTRMHASGTRLPVATRLYATPKYDRQTPTSSARGEERWGIRGMPHNPS
jgi:hypothetical protein